MRRIHPTSLLAKLAALAFLALGSLGAFAQQAASQSLANQGSAAQGMAAMFTPEESDLTEPVLKAIFGEWNGPNFVPFLGESMSYYNASIMLFGVLLYTFLGTISVVQTAKDGVLLGKKLSATWIPIRFVAAMALLIPLSSGYSRIQSIALNGAVLGGGSASKIWSTMASSVISPPGEIAAAGSSFKMNDSLVPGAGPGATVARNIFSAMVCVHHHNQNMSAINAAAPAAASGAPAANGAIGQGSSDLYWFYQKVNSVPGVSKTASINFGYKDSESPECGRYSAPTIPNSDDLRVVANKSPSTNTSVSAWSSIVAAVSPAKPITTDVYALTDISNRQMSVMLKMAEMLSKPAEAQATRDGANPDGTPIKSKHLTQAEVETHISNAAKLYENEMEPTIKNLSQSMSGAYQAYVDQTAKYGWMMAGASIYRISAVRGKISEAIGTASNPSFSGLPTDAGEYGSDASDVNTLTQAVQSDHSYFERLSLSWAQSLSNAITVDPSSPTHAIIQIKQNGDTLVNVGTSMYATYLILKPSDDGGGVGSSLAMKFLPDSVKNYASAFLAGALALIGLVLLSGFTMAYVIPLLPFITSIGNIVGWLMATFSAVVATPAWMAAHFHPNGDELVGRGAGGYMILLESAFRPAFLVIGLAGGYKISDTAVRLFSILSPVATSGLQVYTATGLISFLFFVGLNVVTVLTICRTCMRFSDALQNKVFTWIGGAHAGYDAGQDLSSKVDSSTRGFESNAGRVYGAMGASLEKARKTAKPEPDRDPSAKAAIEGAADSEGGRPDARG